jgi:4-hydroxythreonine-4-phosphate dehydrogenase
LGLNPHCGDGGVIGKKMTYKAVLKKLFEKGTLVFGPFAADSFGVGNMKIRCCYSCTYHDQVDSL